MEYREEIILPSPIQSVSPCIYSKPRFSYSHLPAPSTEQQVTHGYSTPTSDLSPLSDSARKALNRVSHGSSRLSYQRKPGSNRSLSFLKGSETTPSSPLPENGDEMKVSMTLYRRDMAKLQSEKQWMKDLNHKLTEEVANLQLALEEREIQRDVTHRRASIVPKLEAEIQILAAELAVEREVSQRGLTDADFAAKYVAESSKVHKLERALWEAEQQKESHVAQIADLEQQNQRLPYLEQELQAQRLAVVQLESQLQRHGQPARITMFGMEKERTLSLQEWSSGAIVRDKSMPAQQLKPPSPDSIDVQPTPGPEVSTYRVQDSAIKVSSWLASASSPAVAASQQLLPAENVVTPSKSEHIAEGDSDDCEEDLAEYDAMKRKLQEMRGMVEQGPWRDMDSIQFSVLDRSEDGDSDIDCTQAEILLEEELQQRKEQIVMISQQLMAALADVEAAKGELKKYKGMEEKLESLEAEVGRLKEEKRILEAENQEKLSRVEAEYSLKLQSVNEELARASKCQEERQNELMTAQLALQNAEADFRSQMLTLTGKCNGLEALTVELRGKVQSAEDCSRKQHEEAWNLKLSLEEAARKLTSVVEENDELRGLVEEKEREMAEMRDSQMDLEQRCEAISVEMQQIEQDRNGLEIQVQEGEMQKKVLEGGWSKLQERVEALQKEVEEERVKGMKLQEVHEEEESRKKQEEVYTRVIACLEEEKRSLEDRVAYLESIGKEQELVLKSQENEMMMEKMRVGRLLTDMESKQREAVEREKVKVTQMRNREKEVLIEEIARLQNRISGVDNRAKSPTHQMQWPM